MEKEIVPMRLTDGKKNKHVNLLHTWRMITRDILRSLKIYLVSALN